jgi:hypothetical protein
VVLAGGGIRGGQVHGSSDRIAAYPATAPVRPEDLSATVYHLLGIDPRTEVRDHLGRPLSLSDGTPLTALFSAGGQGRSGRLACRFAPPPNRETG